MQRREFLLKTAFLTALSGPVLANALTSQHSTHADPAVWRRSIDSDVDLALTRLYNAVHGSRELVQRARGVLVFPSVLAAGFFVGGQHGEGALRISERTVGYYSTTSASAGLQFGAQSKSIFFLFMTQASLDQFRHSNGWSIGGNASVAVLKVGANGNIDTRTASEPVLAFVLTNRGLMANLTLEGTKVSKLDL